VLFLIDYFHFVLKYIHFEFNLQIRFNRKQGICDLTNILINGKDANWDGDDPLPFTVDHLLQLPDLIWNTLFPSKEQTSNKLQNTMENTKITTNIKVAPDVL